ncbi:hypothetical protein [Sphaerimonospora thailandensis]|uniref:Uncharacterized protein n=1 Tax=Sphaerimonospora thailandensis TaxID=795644 RepID=A0A8J3VY63_9ACTN|nr:hypothetical protein [Sphaerimonospora thailandensis]GIH69152.1 hypothetical protein Mth01_14050 [Sphaerimonospora thailandensis]
MLSALDTKDAQKATGGVQHKEIFTTSSRLADGTYTSIRMLRPDGSLVVDVGGKDQAENGKILIPPKTLGLYSREGYRPFPGSVRIGADRQRQIDSLNTNGPITAWSETESTSWPFPLDWRVVAYNAADHSTNVLGDSTKIAGTTDIPEAAGGTSLVVGKHQIFWATAYPIGEDKRPFGTKIITSRPDGEGGMTVVAENAKLPAVVGDDLYYVRTNEIAPQVPEGRYEIWRRSPEGKHDPVLSGTMQGEQTVTVLKATPSGRLAWVVSAGEKRTSTLFLWEPTDNTATTITMHHFGAPTMSLDVTDRLVAWGDGSANDGGEYVFDRKQGKIWHIHTEVGFSSARTAGDFIAWSDIPEGENFAIWHVAHWKG